MIPPLKEKCALVTGGSRGIGAAIVRRLARDGAHVALTYVGRSDEANEKAAHNLGVRALAIQADSDRRCDPPHAGRARGAPRRDSP